MREIGPSDLEHPSTDVARGTDLSVVRLVSALRTRPGHVLVTGNDPSAVERLFARVEEQLATCRRVRVSGRDLDPIAVVLALWGAVSAESSITARAMMQALVGAARLMEQPILVTVTNAEDAGADALARLQQTLECVPAAEEFVRLALLGGPRLQEVLREPAVRDLATRIVVAVRVPGEHATDETVSVPIDLTTPARNPAGVIVALAALALVAGWLAWQRPTTPVPREEPAAVAQSPAPTAAPAPEVAAEPSEPPAAAPVPDVVPEAAPANEPTPAAPVPAPSPIAAPQPALQPELAPQPGTALQVAAYRTRMAAEALRVKLGDRFGAVSITTVERDGTTYHRVRVGGFASEADLGAAAAALRAAGYAPMRVRD
jgi:cell division septation protein DedD